LPRKAKGLSESDFQHEQLRLLQLIHEELRKLNSNLAISAKSQLAEPLSELEDESDEELEAFE
jgi:hypothetical protein